MSIQVLMPALSPTMTEGKLAKWLKSEGDYLEPGDAIAEIETDKATMEVEAVDPGFLKQILVAEDTENVPVNTPIAIMTDTVAEQLTEEQLVDEQIAEETYSKNVNKQENTKGSDNIVQNSGETVSQTVREALRDAMAEEMRADDMVYVMGEEVAEYEGAYKVTQGLLKEFGEKRVIDTPITEHGFAGLGVGAAFGSLRPVVEFMTFNFAMQAMDQIINSAAKTLYMSGGQMGAPMVFRGPNGAAARVGAQHSQDYAAWYMQIPGLKVVMPYSASDAKGLMKTAIRDPNPVVFLENEIMYGKSFDVPDIEDYTVPFGKARIWREGTDVTIVSFGIGMTYALEAAEKLAEEGIDAEVIDLRTLRPMDTASIIKSVMKTNRLVTVEEGWPQGSVGNYISSVIMQEAFDYLDAPVINCTGKDVPMPYAANLEKLALVTTDEVIAAVKKVTYK